MLWITFLLFFVGDSLAQVPGNGPCPKVQPLANFEISKYLGKWYDAESYASFFENRGSCNTMNYTVTESASVKVRSTKTLYPRENVVIEGTLRFDPASQGVDITLDNTTVLSDRTVLYWVLDTNYVDWGLVWGCVNFQSTHHLGYSWIWTRKPHPSQSVLKEARKAATKHGLEKKYFSTSNQNNCPAGY